jgi:hypothetical protein
LRELLGIEQATRDFLDHPPRQDFALNLSTKRRLCHTVGGRLIDGAARCCAVSTARSRAAATTNLARSNQSLVLRGPRWPGAKSCALVKFFMICPRCRLAASDHDAAPGSRPSHGSRDPVAETGSKRKHAGDDSLTPSPPQGVSRAPDPVEEKRPQKDISDFSVDLESPTNRLSSC